MPNICGLLEKRNMDDTQLEGSYELLYWASINLYKWKKNIYEAY